MITGAVKNKVDQIWLHLYSGGITNPLTVIEQLTYLMFIRSLDKKEQENEKMANIFGEPVSHPIFPNSEVGRAMRWDNFKDKNPEEMFNIISRFVFPAIKAMKHGQLPDFDADGKLIPVTGDNGEVDDEETAFSKYMADAIFLIPTPKHIRDMMVALIQPTPKDTICDPACGTAGFLISSAEYVRAHYGSEMTQEEWDHFAGPMFTGFDMDHTMLRISAMNLMLHSITHPNIAYKDSLSKQNEISDAFSVCLANPPFKGSINKESISEDLKAVANTTKTELLFLALFLRMLKKGGRCACIVPDGVLFGSSKAHKMIRKELVENHQLQGVISMPSGVFKPYAGVSTAILLFTKTGAGGTENVWFYDMKADGYSLDDKRTEVAENDIPDIIERFHHIDQEAGRKRTEQSFLVPKKDIVDQDYDLSINKYKEIEYVPVEYPPTKEILKDLKSLEEEISQGLKDLEGML